MRMSRPLVLAASTALLVLPLSACGGDEQDPAKALRDAVSAVSGKGSAELVMETRDPEDGTSTREGKFSWKPGSRGADVVMQTADSKDFEQLAGSDGKARLLSGKDFFYVELDSPLNGRKWLDLSGDSGSEQDTTPDNGPETAIAALATADDLKKAGTEKVNGQDTDHYTGTVDVAELAETKLQGVSGNSRDEYAENLRNQGLKKVRIEVWIGDDGLAVRTVESGRTAKGAYRETVDIKSYGDGFTVDRPPASEVATLEEFVRSLQ
ncbi:hypothetical protein AB0M28_08280 [Streptomyces sp. NPDC051940]|uniref:hypothetical protein n=1 Tax=Streptomyces sp. NPDC051940 TaxID=3155675 RepID=UPI00343E29CD